MLGININACVKHVIKHVRKQNTTRHNTKHQKLKFKRRKQVQLVLN